MSQYTTMLRWICEQETGKTGSSYATVIEAACPIIFNFDFPIFDESYRTEFETKFIKHFYMREIGSETAGLFKLRLDEKLNLIMPYYNKMYIAAAKNFDFMNTENLTETTHNEGSAKASASGTNSGKSVSKNSDTPQGTIQNLEDGKYLTNAAIDNTDSTTGSNSDASNTDDGTHTFIGYRGFVPSDLLKQYYASLVNVDKLVFDDCEDLFMQIF